MIQFSKLIDITCARRKDTFSEKGSSFMQPGIIQRACGCFLSINQKQRDNNTSGENGKIQTCFFISPERRKRKNTDNSDSYWQNEKIYNEKFRDFVLERLYFFYFSCKLEILISNIFFWQCSRSL